MVALVPPLAASAQGSAAQQRMMDAQRNLRTYEQNQRVDEVQRNVDNLDVRLRTQENLRNLETQRVLIPGLQSAPLVSPAPPATPADLRAAEQRRAAALAASDARLRILAEQQNR
jgi:hypothetical protein